MLDQLFTCKPLLATAYWRSSHKGDLVNVLTKKDVSFSRSPETSLISSAKTSLMKSSWWDKETEVTNWPSSKTEVSNNYSGNWHPTPTYVSTPKRYKKKLTTYPKSASLQKPPCMRSPRQTRPSLGMPGWLRTRWHGSSLKWHFPSLTDPAPGSSLVSVAPVTPHIIYL